MFKMVKDKKGFTLVELMVVVAIVGINICRGVFESIAREVLGGKAVVLRKANLYYELFLNRELELATPAIPVCSLVAWSLRKRLETSLDVRIFAVWRAQFGHSFGGTQLILIPHPLFCRFGGVVLKEC
jgi:prepilin-type N-terminal cleavage/methylation domain-containing protein